MSVRYERSGRYGRVVLDRPPLNILDLDMLQRLLDATAEAGADRDAEGLIVTGAGRRAFSAGVAVEDHTPDRIDTMLGRFHEALRGLLDLEVPTVATIQGHCLGGGMELAAACDFRIAADDATFGQPEIRVGCFPPFAAALYPSRLGVGPTIDLLLSGRTIDVREAERIGFVDRVVPASELGAAAAQRLDSLAGFSRPVARLTLRAIRAGAAAGREDALAASERIYREQLSSLEDLREGVTAFTEKRPPAWKHA